MTNPLNRRDILRLGAAGAAASLPAWAAAQNKVTLIYSDIVSENDPRSKALREVFIAGVEPEFEVKAYHGGTLFKQGTEPVAMQRGNLDLANLAAFDVQRQIPEWSIMTTPYLFRDVAHMQKFFASDIAAGLNKQLEEKMGIKVLAVPYIGTRHLNLKPKKRINTPADLAGIKLRMPPGDAWQFVGTALGANPTPMAFPEVYTGLQTGAIDAQDNPLGANKSMKFYEVTSQIVLTSHLMGFNHFTIALKKWEALSAGQKQKLMAASAKFEDAITQLALKDERENVEFFKKEGLEIYTPDVAAFRRHVLAEYGKSRFAKDWAPGMLERINAL
jgi:TRAP-type transport system periplasmic protein